MSAPQPSFVSAVRDLEGPICDAMHMANIMADLVESAMPPGGTEGQKYRRLLASFAACHVIELTAKVKAEFYAALELDEKAGETREEVV